MRTHSLDFIFKAERVFDPSSNLSLSLVPFLELSSNYNECFVIIKTYAGDHRRGSSSDRRGCTQSFLHIWMHRDDLAGSMLSIVSHDFITYGLDKWFEILWYKRNDRNDEIKFQIFFYSFKRQRTGIVWSFCSLRVQRVKILARFLYYIVYRN